MIVTAFNPETTDLERTFLSQYEAEGSASLHVKNNDRFATTQAILIGKMGTERAEIALTDGVVSVDEITLDGTTFFGHNADDPVYILQWDQIRFYSSATIDGTYVELDTVQIDVDNEDDVTRYNDTAGAATDYYKVKYYNSATAQESDFSDPIRSDGYDALTAGKVIDAVVRRVRDTSYTILGINEYLDIMSEVNEDLLTQSHRPYRFQKMKIALNTTAATPYVNLATAIPDFWKLNYVEYTWTIGGVDRTYQIQPISQEDFARKYDNSNWIDSDELIDVALDEDGNRILLGPGPRTSQTGVLIVHYWRMIPEITSLGDEVITPTTLLYRYKMMAEFFSAKAEGDRALEGLAQKYEGKYGNEVVKLQKSNRLDAGTPRSFAPKRVPSMRKRFVL